MLHVSIAGTRGINKHTVERGGAVGWVTNPVEISVNAASLLSCCTFQSLKLWTEENHLTCITFFVFSLSRVIRFTRAISLHELIFSQKVINIFLYTEDSSPWLYFTCQSSVSHTSGPITSPTFCNEGFSGNIEWKNISSRKRMCYSLKQFAVNSIPGDVVHPLLYLT